MFDINHANYEITLIPPTSVVSKIRVRKKKREPSGNFCRYYSSLTLLLHACTRVCSWIIPKLKYMLFIICDPTVFTTESLATSTTSSASAELDVHPATTIEMSSHIGDEAAQSNEAAALVSSISKVSVNTRARNYMQPTLVKANRYLITHCVCIGARDR